MAGVVQDVRRLVFRDVSGVFAIVVKFMPCVSVDSLRHMNRHALPEHFTQALAAVFDALRAMDDGLCPGVSYGNGFGGCVHRSPPSP